MTKIVLLPSTPIYENSKAPRVSDIQVGSSKGRRFLYIKNADGKIKEFKINDLVKALENAVKNEEFQPEDLENIRNSIVKFTNTKNSGLIHTIRSFVGNFGFKRESRMESISQQIKELKHHRELQRHQKFQYMMNKGNDLNVYANREVDALISPLFYKDSEGADKKFISYGIPSGKTAENVAEGIIQDLKEYSKKSADKTHFKGLPINEADRKFMLNLGSKASNEPDKTKAALVHLILSKKAADEKTVYISATDQEAINTMKGIKEVDEVAKRLVAQCIDPTTDVDKLKKMLGHNSVKNNKELKNAIIENAINVQVINLRACQVSFITPLLGNAGMALKKVVLKLKENPNNTENLNGVDGLRIIAMGKSIPFPTNSEIEQKQKNGSLDVMFNTYVENYEEAVRLLNEIKEMKGK